MIAEEDVDPKVYSEIARWAKLAKGNDYYGILRYAIALEAENTTHSHYEAVQQLKKAFSLEPRILSPSWLSAQYEWNDSYEQLLQNLTNDQEFQFFKRSHG